MKGIAFFDLDGTITKNDTFIDFIIFVCGKFNFYLGLLYLGPYIFLYLINQYPNFKLKEKVFKFYLAKYDEQELKILGDRYSHLVLPRFIYSEALQKIQWHQKNSDRVIIITASSPIWLGGWCAQNNLEIIGTLYESLNGKYTGKILGRNCYGTEKMNIVKKILSVDNYSKTYGYGNSKGDLPFLNIVGSKHYKPFKK